MQLQPDLLVCHACRGQAGYLQLLGSKRLGLKPCGERLRQARGPQFAGRAPGPRPSPESLKGPGRSIQMPTSVRNGPVAPQVFSIYELNARDVKRKPVDAGYRKCSIKQLPAPLLTLTRPTALIL